MAVLDRSTSYKQLTTSLLGSLLLGVLLFAVQLISSATQLSNTTGQVQGGVGPLYLFELTRLPLAGGGYSGGVRLLPMGLGMYFILWLIAGGTLAVMRSRKV